MITNDILIRPLPQLPLFSAPGLFIICLPLASISNGIEDNSGYMNAACDPEDKFRSHKSKCNLDQHGWPDREGRGARLIYPLKDSMQPKELKRKQEKPEMASSFMAAVCLACSEEVLCVWCPAGVGDRASRWRSSGSCTHTMARPHMAHHLLNYFRNPFIQ